MTLVTDDRATGVIAPVEPAPAPVPQVLPPQQVQPQPIEDVPRLLNPRTVDDRMTVLGSAVASLAFVWVGYEHVLLWSGVLGFFVCWWLVFVAMFIGVSAMSSPLPILMDRAVSVIVLSGAAVVGLALTSTIVYIGLKGFPAYSKLNFYTHDMAGVSPNDPLTRGGILHAIIGSAVEVAIATLIALPLGVTTAVYMTEVGGQLAKIVRTVVEAMTALPDVLAGLFIYAVFIIVFHWDKTGMAVALALAVTMVPTVARSAEVVLRVVPSGLREASLALGASRWQTVRRVVIPTSKSGLATSLILGIARIAGETAPLLIVSVATTRTNYNPLRDPMNSLPLFIYQSIKSGQKLAIQRGYGAAAVLLALVLILFTLTRFLARDKNGAKR